MSYDVPPLPGRPGTIEVGGILVHYTRLASRGRPPLMLLHGAGGHRGWWSAVTPLLAPHFDLIAPDLGGHGDSGRRETYDPAMWAQEAAAIATVMERGPVTIVGTSMGGLVGIYTAARYAALVERLILIDAPVLRVQARDVPVVSKAYPTFEDAITRFKLRPPETYADPALIDHISRAALEPVEGGWAWKYDGRASQRYSVAGVAAELARVSVPVGCIYGGSSPYFDEASLDYIVETLGRPVPTIRIERAHHHVQLDAPEQVAEAIRTLHEDLGLNTPLG